MSENNRLPKYYASPVDYEAWRNGYMPPSEHILIHKLSVGDVDVIGSAQNKNWGWWLVAFGDIHEDDYDEIYQLLSRAFQRARKRKKEVEQAEAESSALPENHGSPDDHGEGNTDKSSA